MSPLLPVNVEALLRGRRAESARLEFKARWCPETTGFQVLRTICAFANDHLHLNGGYVVVGVAEEDGRAVFPPVGLSDGEMQAAAKWIRGQCNRIDPVYQPVVSPEVVDGRNVLVIWAPASEARPHRAPGGRQATGESQAAGGRQAAGGPSGRGDRRRYWIRLGAETVDAEAAGLLPALVRQTARVPWDDRRALGAKLDDLREGLVREFLRDVDSELRTEPDAREVYRRMRITARANDHETPRNVGLLFFSRDPSEWFRGALVEVAQFPNGPGGDLLVEHTFRGGLADQLRRCLDLLDALSEVRVEKRSGTPRARRTRRWPAVAVREALANAAYHRSYEPDAPDPIKVHVYHDRMTISSYPGPVPGVEAAHMEEGGSMPDVPARNRRIGEFLKELGLAEGRFMGLGKIRGAMAENGSPPPRFEFDQTRTYFTTVLPAHTAHLELSGDGAGGTPAQDEDA